MIAPSTPEENERYRQGDESRGERQRRLAKERKARFLARQRGEDVPLRTRSTAKCAVPDCGRTVVARGWCKRCYYRWQRTGDPTLVLTRPLGLDADGALRWTGWTVTEAGCWEWNGQRDHAGYGKIGYGGEKLMAHRLAYETWIGPIPPELLVRHRVCDNPPCINPDHLEVGTQVDNMRDMYERGRNPDLRGEAHPAAKLTTADVIEIRRLAESTTQAGIARIFDVSESLVRQIIHRQAWSHV